jgi:hypothetical protein
MFSTARSRSDCGAAQRKFQRMRPPWSGPGIWATLCVIVPPPVRNGHASSTQHRSCPFLLVRGLPASRVWTDPPGCIHNGGRARLVKGEPVPMSSKTSPDPESPPVASAPRRRSKSVGPAHRPERGAASHPAPTKAEMGAHRVPLHPRPPPTREEIARRAYEIWEQCGCVSGQEREHWLQAERELWAVVVESSGSADQR